jgi:thiosulfate/3-mercaptopyruvate sulfurtransferase
MSMADLPEFLAGRENQGIIVLYSNGMTHPAQTRDALFRMGFTNVYILTDGLAGFLDRILKPASLRTELLSAEQTARINEWRSFFLGMENPAQAEPEKPLAVSEPVPPAWPGLVEPAWLAEHGRPFQVRQGHPAKAVGGTRQCLHFPRAQQADDGDHPLPHRPPGEPDLLCDALPAGL